MNKTSFSIPWHIPRKLMQANLVVLLLYQLQSISSAYSTQVYCLRCYKITFIDFDKIFQCQNSIINEIPLLASLQHELVTYFEDYFCHSFICCVICSQDQNKGAEKLSPVCVFTSLSLSISHTHTHTRTHTHTHLSLYIYRFSAFWPFSTGRSKNYSIDTPMYICNVSSVLINPLTSKPQASLLVQKNNALLRW